MRTIDADELKKCAIPCEIHNGSLTDLCVPLYQIDNAPTVELKQKERPQGKWVGNAFNEHHCNRCGHPALWEEEPDDYYEVQSKFCPNCGACMQEGGTE